MIDYLTVNLYKNTAALQTDGHIFQLVTETVIHASLDKNWQYTFVVDLK
jgi:hypothetical protein